MLFPLYLALPSPIQYIGEHIHVTCIVFTLTLELYTLNPLITLKPTESGFPCSGIHCHGDLPPATQMNNSQPVSVESRSKVLCSNN